jgi:hypothetical protein
MAHPTSTATRVQRLSALVAIVLVAVAVGFAFGRILVGHGATYTMLAVGLASGAIAWVTERNGMLVATAASGCALLFALAWLVAPETTWYGLPTVETVRTLGTLATQVGAQAREYVSPAPATPALVMAGAVAVWAAVFSCAALAFRAQSPLLALVPPIALVVFADSVLDEVDRPAYGVLFLFAAVAVLFADSLRRLRGWGPVWSPPGARDRLLPVAGRNARRVGLTAVVLAAFAPALVPGFGTTAVVDISRFGSDNRIRVSPLVSMGSILSDAASDPEDNPEVFQVSATAGSYWRMVALDTFDGNTWEATNDEGVQLTGDTIQRPPTAGTSVTQTFTVSHDLGFGWLVGAAEPTDISIGHDVWWHPASASLQMDGWPDEGETYTVTSVRPDVDAAAVRTAETSAVSPAETALPDDIPPLIHETALRWTEGAETAFDKTMAIVDHLRNGDFQYTLDVDYGDSSDALAKFLQQRQGFCQQFASLTAVMLRTLDIPARVALGFTQGTPAGPGVWSVAAKQYHSWVEVPFKGFGWLSFEPTPRFNDPSATWQRADQATATCGNGPQCDSGGHPGEDPPDTSRPAVKRGGALNAAIDQAFDTSRGGAPIASRPLELVAVVAVAIALLLGLAVPLARRAHRRRRIRSARTPRELILAHYDVFADRALELGWPRSPGETPDEFRVRLLDNDRLAEEREPLRRLTAAVVGAAYGPEDPDGVAVDDIRADTSAVLDGLRALTPWRRRLVGLYRRAES